MNRTVANPSRRKFVVTSAAAGGGLVIGMHVPLLSARSPQRSGGRAAGRGQCVGPGQAGRHVRHPHRAFGDGPGHADRPRPARGRGARVRLEQDRLRISDAGRKPRAQARVGRVRHRRQPRHPHLRGLRAPRRRGRARHARCKRRPISGACRRASCTVANGIITHTPTGRKTSYGKVAAAAAKVTPPDPKSLKLRDPREWKVAGKPMKRLDTAPKLNGSLVYAIDVKLPGMLCAAVKDCPVYGGKLVSFDNAAIANMPGVVRAVQRERHHGRGRGRHMVARQEGARRAADRVGRGRQRDAHQRADRRAPERRPDRGQRLRDDDGRRYAGAPSRPRRSRSRRSTARRSSRTPAWSR